VNGGGVGVTKTKKKEKAKQLAIVHRSMQNQTDGIRKIEFDRARQWKLGEELTYGHSLWNDVPIYLDTTDCTIQDQQMYSKVYSKEGYERAFRGLHTFEETAGLSNACPLSFEKHAAAK
jgi:hypothetical protein